MSTPRLLFRSTYPNYNTRIVWLIAFSLMVSIGEMAAQTLSYNGGLCTGNYLNFYVQGSMSCAPFVSSQGSWTVNPAPSEISYVASGNGSLGQIQVKWNSSSVVNASISVSYSCAEGGSGTLGPLNLSLSPAVVPAVTLSAASSVCQGTGLLFTASATNGGGSPSYSFYLDGSTTPSYNGYSNTYTLSTGSLSAGSHNMKVSMFSNLPCASPSSATSTTINFTVNAKSTFNANLNAPALVCQGTSTIVPTISVSGTYGNLSYEWFVNGSPQSGGSSLTVNANQGTQVYAKVHSDGCVNTPVQTSTYSVNITPITTPTASIQIPKTGYCNDENIVFTASSPQANASSTYQWYLNGTQLSLPSTATQATVTAKATVIAGNYYPGSSIRVVVSGLTGQCLQPASAEYTVPTNLITVSPNPRVSAADKTICSDASSAVALSEPDGIPGTSFTWTASNSNTYGASNSFGSTINQQLKNDGTNSTNGTTNGTATYVVTPTANGCVGTSKTVIVTVKPKTKITNTPAQLVASICSGNALNFTPSLSIAGSTYSWTSSISGTITPASVSASGTTAITNAPINSGNQSATVTYAITPSFSSCAGSTVNYVVTVKPLPTVSLTIDNQITNATICSASNAILYLANTNGVSGTTLSWTATASNVTGASGGSGSTINQTLSSPVGSSGSVTYVATATANGCPGITANKVITVNPKPVVPTVTGHERFGPGTYSLTASGGSGSDTYSWTVPSTSTNFTGNPFLTPSVASQTLSYCTVKITNSFGCVGNAKTVDAIMYPIPVIAATAAKVYMGSSSTLSAGAFAYDTYEWRNSSNALVASSATFNATIADTYTVKVFKGAINTTSATFILKGQLSDLPGNYIIAQTMLSEGITNATLTDSVTVKRRAQSIQYFDGLGRPLQTVATQASPGKRDVVTPVVYDAFGREYRKYLPFTAPDATSYKNDGWYKPNGDVLNGTGQYAGSAQPFYATPNDEIADDAKPFAETVFEPSPLNRVSEVGAPGVTWQPGTNHTIKKYYEVNTGNEVYIFRFSAGSLLREGFYGPGQLYKSRTTDEKQNEVLEFTDKEGKTLCKKVQHGVDGGGVKLYASTYYVYDDFGNLVLVLPPAAIQNIATN